MTDQAKLKRTIVNEILKCKKDPIYFMKEYVWIQHPTIGRTKFKLYPFQEKVLSDLVEHQDNIILKSRQLGITTLIAALALHMMLFYSDKNILAIATKTKTAKNLVTKVAFAYKELPKWMLNALGIKHTEFNKLSLALSNGSVIKAASAASDDARSEAISLLAIDEAAFIRNAKTVWASAQSTLSTGGKSIIFSTPNGQKGWFFDMWNDAIEGENDLNPIKLDWRVHPDRDQKWRDAQTRKLGVKMADQECEASFLSSGDTMIDGETIDWYEQNTVIMEPINKLYHDNLWLWGEPDSTKQYMIPVDVSRGDATDYSSFHILDIETLEQVGEYKGKVPTPELPKILAEVGYMWNTAVISIENASMGWGVVQDMITAEYPNLYYTPKKEITNEYEYQDLEHFTPGFTNSSKSRPLMISKFEEYINNKLIIIRGIRTINELKRFVWLNHKAQAAPGANDDLMLSLAQGIYLREPILRFFKLGIANYHNNKKENLAVFSSYKPGFNTMNKTNRRVKDTYFDNNETTFQRNKMKEHTKSRSKMVPLP
jgi:hypothetical protein